MTALVIGAGLAGLSAALALADAGWEVELHEAAGQAGGRCRSWWDPTLNAKIDNGSHLLVGGNAHAFGFLRRIGAVDSLVPGPQRLRMMDLTSGERWQTAPLRLLPNILAAIGSLANPGDSVLADRLGRSAAYDRFWQPLALAIMNTPPDQASSALFRRVLAKTLWRGGAASRIHQVRQGLSASFVDPALRALTAAGVTVRFHHPLRSIILRNGKAVELNFDDQDRQLSRHDLVVLAVPWHRAHALIPALPNLPSQAIVNAHFRISVTLAEQFGEGPIGLLGGQVQWLFRRGTLLSATISAADGMAERSIDELAETLWGDICKSLVIYENHHGFRIIKERRATLHHSPKIEKLRPQNRYLDNLLLAGDWTDTGLPCTLEGAILSGTATAKYATNRRGTG